MAIPSLFARQFIRHRACQGWDYARIAAELAALRPYEPITATLVLNVLLEMSSYAAVHQRQSEAKASSLRDAGERKADL